MYRIDLLSQYGVAPVASDFGLASFGLYKPSSLRAHPFKPPNDAVDLRQQELWPTQDMLLTERW
jgi:hypothetical protein